MQEVLDAMNDWELRNKMKLNAEKTKDMWICFKAAIPEPPSLKIGNDTIERVNSFKLLGFGLIIPLNGTRTLKKLLRKQKNADFTYGNVVEKICQPNPNMGATDEHNKLAIIDNIFITTPKIFICKNSEEFEYNAENYCFVTYLARLPSENIVMFRTRVHCRMCTKNFKIDHFIPPSIYPKIKCSNKSKYRRDANVLTCLNNDPSYEFIGEDKSLSDFQTLIKHSFLLNFLHELLSFLNQVKSLVLTLSNNYNTVMKTFENNDDEFQSYHEKHANSKESPKTRCHELQQLNTDIESNTEDVSYVVLLEDWDILPNKLNVLDRTLGAGKFGIVKHGLYTPSENDYPMDVAVKMLKENATEQERLDLVEEIKILKKVNEEPHPNIIRFIGACSIEGKLLVVTEFCPGGNLRKFLIKNRANYVNIISRLTNRQLLTMALDVANGMVHLSAQKVVHRDLAARNILIGQENIAKICDFGLTRDIRSAEEYVRHNQNLLPVKWMAVESLVRGRFTTASDVWSFGVLLYEITTLGEEPYKNISPYDIINHVGCGCRMSKPSHCSDEV
ncbi:Angiopoietin-1 receptor, partial [Paramuricea clavata]